MDHSDLLFMPRKKMKKSRAWISFAVISILTVSFFISIYYWWVLSGFSDAIRKPDTSWVTLFLLLMTVATGAVTELVKKVSLADARHPKVWIFATLVSIVTVMGTYAILDQDRKNSLQAGSQAQETNVSRQSKNDEIITNTGYANSIGLAGIAALRAKNKDNLDNEPNYPRVKFNLETKRIDKIETDYYAYQNAIGQQTTLDKKVAKGGEDVVTNPLLHNVAELIAHGKTNIVVTLFYLAVTVLLEWAAYVFAARVEAIDMYLENIDANIADYTNQQVFGFTMKEVQRDLREGAIQHQRDQIDLKNQIRTIQHQNANNGAVGKRKSLVDKLKEKLGSFGSTNPKPAGNHSNNSSNTGTTSRNSVLDGLSYDELVDKNAVAKANTSNTGHCVTCDCEFTRVNKSLYCKPDHSREYQKILKRAKRAEGI